MCLNRGCAHTTDPVRSGAHGGPDPDAGGLDRRRLLMAAAAGAALTLAPISFRPARAAGAPSGDVTRVVTGHLETGAADFVYLPLEIPDGVRKIAVEYSYDKPEVPPGTPGNSCDIGIFDQRGIALGGPGFRGWSGGFRTSFEISNGEATPGYLPGPIEPGTWHVVLGPYQVAPQGMNYRVQVTLTFGEPGPAFVPNYPPRRAKGRGHAWYRGDGHLHTVYSDGRRLPAEVAAGARAAGLDFIVTTDHNTSASHAVWGEHAGEDLLVVIGEEITTRNGHWLALGLRAGEWVDWRYRARDDAFGRFARQVHRSGGLVVPAHPYCPFIGCQWKFGYEHADAVEVWNGPWTADDEIAVAGWDAGLAEAVRRGGRWTPAVGNSDAHSEPQVIGLPQNVVYASELSTGAILAGIRAGRCWIAESSAVRLSFTVTGHGRQAGMGQTLSAPADAPIDVRLDVAGVPNGVVRFVTDEGQMHQESLPASGTGGVAWRTTTSLAAYVRAEVRHPDGAPLMGSMAAMTNPVFLKRTGG